MALNNRLIFLIVICIPILTLGFTTPSSSAALRITSVNLFAKNDQNDNESLSSSSSNNSINRRLAIQQTSGIALSSLLLGTSGIAFSPQLANAAESYEDTKKKQRILITGCNSGIGFDAAERLAMRGHEIVLACVSFFMLLWCWCMYNMVFAILKIMLTSYAQNYSLLYSYISTRIITT